MAATAKKSSKAKTKSRATSKKKTKSTAKKATAKKAVAQPVVKVNKETTQDKLRKFNILAAVSNALFAVLSIIFVSKDTVTTYLPYAARDEFASSTSTVFGPAFKNLCEVEIRFILAFIFGLSAVFSLLLLTRLKKQYESQVANSVSVLRWVFSGIGLGLLLELSSVLTEVDNIVTLKTIGILVVITSVLWIMSEKQNRGTKGKLALYYLSVVVLLVAVMPILVSFLASGLYGMERFGWQIYALAAVVIGGLAAFAYNQYKAAKNGVSAKGYLELEGKYLRIDYLVKLLTFVIFLTALFK